MNHGWGFLCEGIVERERKKLAMSSKAFKHGPFTSIFHSSSQSIQVKIFAVSLRRSRLGIESRENAEFDC